MRKHTRYGASRFLRSLVTAAVGFFALAAGGTAAAFTIQVVDPSGSPVSGFRYLVERDNTNQPRPGVPSTKVISLDTHKSHAKVVATGRAAGNAAAVALPRRQRYFVSVLPDAGFAMSGAPRAPGQDVVVVTVQPQPIPTAQISVLAFVDQSPINDGYDPGETGLGRVTVVISDAGGPLSADAFGNPLGTRYNPDGSVAQMGTGVITTLTREEFDGGPATNPDNLRVGEALIKNLAPGKYGVIAIPPPHDDAGGEATWVQTTTIEGTPTIDAWVKANEPRLFVEGFGTGFKHVIFGYVKTSAGTQAIGGEPVAALPWNAGAPGTATIAGTLRWNHFAKPPFNQGFFPGEPVPECWVGLNNPAGAGTPLDPAGLVAVPCDADSRFTLSGIPAGTYNLVWWDKPLDGLFGFASVTVADGQSLDLGDILAFRWFGTLKGMVFEDLDQDGYRDPAETVGFPGQNLNLRFRDGSVYQATPTDSNGEYGFTEVFPFFKWLVAEVDFTRYKATGMTTAVDNGGAIPVPAPGQYEWELPSFGALNPQAQAAVNPNTGNNLSRTETGPVLTQAMMLFLNQTNVIDWGKVLYGPGENGGISGIVFYDTTRAENDPAWNGGEPWQPGVPDVQVALYEDNLTNASGEVVPDGIIDDVNRDGRIKVADVDNAPFGWADGRRKGPEDVDYNGNGVWDPGDAVSVVWTDSWDRNEPRGCVQNLPLVHGVLAGMCADAYSTWNQVRPGVFDGGYAFTQYAPGGIVAGRRPRPLPAGTYIVGVAPPPGYLVVKEEDKNVDFGDEYVPGTLLLPPPCVGDPHVVPAELTLFPGVPAPFAGETRPLCDRRQVQITADRNAAADFFVFTEVPKAARAFGFTNNDLSAEFNMASPNFGEKLSPSWIPVAFRDWTGKEVTRVYADEYGHYNALLPSTFTINVPAPSGVSPNMMTLVLNDPFLPDGTPDPFYNPVYSVTPWTFQYYPGTTTYLDTPLVPLAAFAAHGGGIDTDPATVAAIGSVAGPETNGGPYMCTSRVGAERTVTITARGKVRMINPNYNPNDPRSRYIIRRNYGFGAGTGRVTLDGVDLAVLSWSRTQIVAQVPDGIATGGRLMVTRASGVSSEVGVRFSFLDCTPGVETIIHVPADYPTIQAAIDAAPVGAYVFVAPGSYRENVVLNKPLRLQGSGSGLTLVNGDPNPMERLQAWHDRLNALGAGLFIGPGGGQPFQQHEASTLLVVGETAVGGDFFNPGFPFPGGTEPRVDNFTFAGSKAGGGVYLAVGAHGVEIANNVVTNNQGSWGGGVVVGAEDRALGWSNQGVVIRQNKIHRNGGVQGPGGIGLYSHSDGYLVEGNLIQGNFGRFNGGGIGHTDACAGTNRIVGNRIQFNETFFGALLAGAGDGGGIFVGSTLLGPLAGTGTVEIEGNLIQGNLAGAGHGGGIRVFGMSGPDIRDNPGVTATWNRLRVVNNVIVNNVAGNAGGGISLQDVVLAEILNNTIANNDATATSALAFPAGQPNSTPQPAGVVAHAHSIALAGILATDGGPTYAGQAFADATLVNNVVWHNRSFFNDAALNAGAGGLAPNPTLPYWDLAVLGGAGVLDPEDCILSQFDEASYDDGTNLAADPLFVAGYENLLTSATVLDEGGNAINVRFQPLLPSTANYHLNPNSPAIDAGQDAGLAADFDGDARPQGLAADIGADEYLAGTFLAVQVLAPNGGERIPAGSAYTFTWGAPAEAHHFTVQLSRDGGRTWRTLARDVLDRFLVWTAPTPPTNQTRYRLRVRAYDVANRVLGSDVSDGLFGVEVVRLLQPNGAEVLLGGSLATVRWLTFGTGSPVTAARVERSYDNGGTWRLVEALPGNPGSYTWAVPDPRGVRARALLRITLLAGTTRVGRDQSDRTFYIRPSLVP